MRNFFKTKRKCFKCHYVGHIIKDCHNTKTTSSSSKGDVFICAAEDVSEQEQWPADSGASAHMTSKKHYFLTYDGFENPRKVEVCSKEFINVFGPRIINVELRIKKKCYQNYITKIGYNPEVGPNLFSIAQATEKW